MKVEFILSFVIFVFLATSGYSEDLALTSNKIDWKKVEIENLPIKFKTKNHLRDITFLKTKNKINNIFSNKTEFKIRQDILPKKYFYPHEGKGYFYKRLPDFNDKKILIFIYENEKQEYYLPFYELQVINKDDKVIDKLIVAGAKEYECAWNREFAIDSNYNITIFDTQSCYDFETEKETDIKEYKNHFYINKRGLIEEKKDCPKI